LSSSSKRCLASVCLRGRRAGRAGDQVSSTLAVRATLARQAAARRAPRRTRGHPAFAPNPCSWCSSQGSRRRRVLYGATGGNVHHRRCLSSARRGGSPGHPADCGRGDPAKRTYSYPVHLHTSKVCELPAQTAPAHCLLLRGRRERCRMASDPRRTTSFLMPLAQTLRRFPPLPAPSLSRLPLSEAATSSAASPG
jgi:hypothetical protein